MFGTDTIVLLKYKMKKRHNLSASELKKLVEAARVLGNVDIRYFSTPDLTSRRDKEDFGVGAIVQMAKDAIGSLPAEEEIEKYCKLFAKYGLKEEENHLRGRYDSLRSSSRFS